MTKKPFVAGEGWRNPATERSTPPRVESSSPPQQLPRPRWEYQWEDSLNAVGERQVEPALPERLVDALVRSVAANADTFTVFVRGELGIGKTTLASLLIDEMRRYADATDDLEIHNALLTCRVLEAEDLESAIDFAKRVNASFQDSSRTVVLARPGTMSVAEQWICEPPTATVTMRTFQPTSPLFHTCLERVADDAELTNEAQRTLIRSLAGRLPDFLQTPFYFYELAWAIKYGSNIELLGRQSPLELFETAIEHRIPIQGLFDDLVDLSIGLREPESATAVAGITDREGFVHDGYRNVVLASAVIQQKQLLTTVLRTPNSLAALRLVLDHAEHVWRGKKQPDNDPLIEQLREFVLGETARLQPQIPFVVYMKGLIAASFAKLGWGALSAELRNECMQLVTNRTTEEPDPALWWDVSDALSMIGDPRLITAKAERFGPTSGYFTFVEMSEVSIGSDDVPKRTDDAKPVLPYESTILDIGPVWVGNYLVTTEQFAEFWSSPDLESHFVGAGARWFESDAELLSEIEREFEVSAARCFWKESAEQQQVAVSGVKTSTMSVLEVARQRAQRRERVRLWDPTQADDRFSAKGNPVVGINWWEAMAYCRWWTQAVLPHTDFPRGSKANLLTDWEWEAIRRRFYNSTDPTGIGSSAAHLRAPTDGSIAHGRHSSVVRPLHVGLFPVPAGPGPFDMIGNVWEWTRSRVFGRIVEQSISHPKFGNSAWDDGDSELERNPLANGRDDTDGTLDLSYRAVRGASFFSLDEQAALNPAYRLSDPPFSSYFDLGFRIAVYGPKE